MQLSQAVSLSSIADNTIFLGYDPTTGKPIQILASQIKSYNPQPSSQPSTNPVESSLDFSSIPTVATLGSSDYILCFVNGTLSKIQQQFLTLTTYLSWELEQTSGSTANDSSGNARNGTYNNCSLNSNGCTFNGTSSIVYANATNTQLNPLTIRVEFNTAIAKTQALFEFRNTQGLGANSFSPALFLNSSGYPSVYGYPSGGFSTSKQVNDGNWHTIYCVMDGNTVTVYLDGANIGSTSGNPLQSFTGYFTLGVSQGVGNSSYFQGMMRNFRVYNMALSASQISALG